MQQSIILWVMWVLLMRRLIAVHCLTICSVATSWCLEPSAFASILKPLSTVVTARRLPSLLNLKRGRAWHNVKWLDWPLQKQGQTWKRAETNWEASFNFCADQHIIIINIPKFNLVIFTSSQNVILSCIKLHYTSNTSWLFTESRISPLDRSFTFIPLNQIWVSLFARSTWEQPSHERKANCFNSKNWN